MKRFYWLTFLMILFGTECLAGSTGTNAKIIAMDTNKGYGNGLVFIKLDVPPSGKPACSNHYWDYTLSFSTAFDDKLYAALLAAFAAGSLVDTTGMGACSDYGSIESLRSVQVMN
jgi:hypothetical protein